MRAKEGSLLGFLFLLVVVCGAIVLYELPLSDFLIRLSLALVPLVFSLLMEEIGSKAFSATSGILAFLSLPLAFGPSLYLLGSHGRLVVIDDVPIREEMTSFVLLTGSVIALGLGLYCLRLMGKHLHFGVPARLFLSLFAGAYTGLFGIGLFHAIDAGPMRALYQLGHLLGDDFPHFVLYAVTASLVFFLGLILEQRP